MVQEKNFLLILLIIIVSISLLISCKCVELSDFDKKVCNAYKIELQKENKNKYKIEKLAKIIEDKEDFVLMRINDIWYVLAINDYNYIKKGDENSKMFKEKGWKVTQSAKFGDYAVAPSLLSDMVEASANKNNYNCSHINKALNLK